MLMILLYLKTIIRGNLKCLRLLYIVINFTIRNEVFTYLYRNMFMLLHYEL